MKKGAKGAISHAALVAETARRQIRPCRFRTFLATLSEPDRKELAKALADRGNVTLPVLFDVIKANGWKYSIDILKAHRGNKCISCKNSS